MKSALVKKWVKALRSGDYVQGTTRLKQRALDGVLKYCCLGVLAEVANLRFKKGTDGCYTLSGGVCGILPSPSKTRLGLSGDAEATLIVLNDTKLYSFKQIARRIEQMHAKGEL